MRNLIYSNHLPEVDRKKYRLRSFFLVAAFIFVGIALLVYFLRAPSGDVGSKTALESANEQQQRAAVAPNASTPIRENSTTTHASGNLPISKPIIPPTFADAVA